MVSDRSKDRSLGLGISCMAGHMVAVGDHRRMTQKGSFAITFTAQLIHSTVQRQSMSRRDGVLNHISGTVSVYGDIALRRLSAVAADQDIPSIDAGIRVAAVVGGRRAAPMLTDGVDGRGGPVSKAA